MDTNIPLFIQLTPVEKKASVEALIFSADEPLSIEALFKLLISNELPYETPKLFPDNPEDEISNQTTLSEEIHDKFEFTLNDIKQLIDDINNDLAETNRPYRIVEVAGGYSFATSPEYGMLIQQLTKTKLKKRLSQAAMEALAIIAYRQPVTKAEVEQIRGVSTIDVINSLVEKHFVEIVGRKESLGKPLIYGTTKEFLRIFGLRSLEDLPKLHELEEIPTADILPETENIEITVDAIDDEFKEIHEMLNQDFHFEPENLPNIN